MLPMGASACRTWVLGCWSPLTMTSSGVWWFPLSVPCLAILGARTSILKERGLSFSSSCQLWVQIWMLEVTLGIGVLQGLMPIAQRLG